MPWRLALLNALAFFSSVIVYFVVLRATSFFPTGPDGQQFLNLWFLLSTALGILSFGLYRIPPMQRRQALCGGLAANLVGLLLLLWAISFAGGHGAFYTGLTLFTLSSGYLMGSIYYQASRHVAAGVLGRYAGGFLALSNLLLFLEANLRDLSGIPLIVEWSILFLSLGLMAWLLLRPLPEPLPLRPVSPHPLILRHMPLLVAVAICLSLLIGLDDSLLFGRYEEYLNWYGLSRISILLGFLLAGWLADKRPTYLPLAAVLSKAVVLLFHAMALEGGPLWLMIMMDAFFASFLIVFLLWMFLHAAPHTRHPELWAGMGRAVELPCSGLGALVGTYCLTSLPVSTSLLAYTTLLVASSALLYHGLMLYATSLQQSEPLLSPAPAINLVAEIKAGAEEAGLPEDIPIQQDAPPISEKISQKQVEQNLQRYQNRYQLTNRETEVLGEILKDASIADMAAALFITQRTAKFHISNILRKTGAKNQRSLRRILEQDDQQD